MLGGSVRRFRLSLPYLLALLLAWVGVWVGYVYNPPGLWLRGHGVPIWALTTIMLAWRTLHVLVPFGFACWLAWRLASKKSSPFRWAVLALAGLALATEASILLEVMPRISLPWDAYGVETWSWYFFLPWAFTLVLLAVVVEPHASAPLPPREGRLAWLLALTFLVLITVPEFVPDSGLKWVMVVLFPLGLLQKVAYPLVLSTGTVLMSAGVPGTAAFLVADAVWVLATWYLIVRTVFAWSISRQAALNGAAQSDGGALSNKRFQRTADMLSNEGGAAVRR